MSKLLNAQNSGSISSPQGWRIVHTPRLRQEHGTSTYHAVRTRGIYPISLLCHVCNSLGLLDYPGWRSDSHRGVLDVSRHHIAGTHGDIISYHHTKQDYTIFSAVFPNCGFFRIGYAVFLRSLPLGGCSEGTHILAKLRLARGVGHSGRFQLPFGAWGQLCLAIFIDTSLTKTHFYSVVNDAQCLKLQI